MRWNQKALRVHATADLVAVLDPVRARTLVAEVPDPLRELLLGLPSPLPVDR